MTRSEANPFSDSPHKPDPHETNTRPIYRAIIRAPRGKLQGTIKERNLVNIGSTHWFASREHAQACGESFARHHAHRSPEVWIEEGSYSSWRLDVWEESLETGRSIQQIEQHDA